MTIERDDIERQGSLSFEQHADLLTGPLSELPLGSIEPLGWLRGQLEIQAQGLTGHLDEVWEDVGPNSGWLGGSGESWERGPYYLDGLVPLAHLLKDERLLAKAHAWIEWTISSQTEQGWFGPSGKDDWWSRMIMLKVLMQHCEATGDERIVPFMMRFFEYQYRHLAEKPLESWGHARGGENILSLQWLYRRTQEPFLLELMQMIHQQTMNWTDIFTDFSLWRYQKQFDHRIHVVNVAMAIKEPGLYSLYSKDSLHRDAVTQGIHNLMQYHGQAYGMFSGDEWLAGTSPSQGVELCAVVEYMYSMEQLIQVFGDGRFADILERVAFNALPAAVSADWHSHQYDQQANQVMCTLAKRNWTSNGDDSNLFGLEPNFGCCTANMHQGWPKFAARLWMATKDHGLASISYAPCRVLSKVAEEVPITLSIETQYPFRDHVHICIDVGRPCVFPLKLRIPSWCAFPRVQVNGGLQECVPDNGFVTLEREWFQGDVIDLELPMKIRFEKRGNYATSVHLGPLLFALPIEEVWQKFRGTGSFSDWEVYPASAWNYGLLNEDGRVFYSAVPTQPFLAAQAPVKIVVQGKRIPSWRLEDNSAAEPPLGPVDTDSPIEEIVMVPYGSTRLRIAEFPTVK